MGAPIPLRANIFPMLENHQNSKLFQANEAFYSSVKGRRVSVLEGVYSKDEINGGPKHQFCSSKRSRETQVLTQR